MSDLDDDRRRLLLQRLSRGASGASVVGVEDIPALDRSRPLRLSAGQRALLAEYRRRPDSAIYNVTHRYQLWGALDVERLIAGLRTVVARHEPLHVAFDDLRSVLPPERAISIERVTASHDDLVAMAGREARTRLDLDQGPLVRAVVADHGDGSHGLILTMHHVSCDAGSLSAFWADLDRAYTGAEVHPLPVGYADHSAWQAARVQSADVDYWVREVVGDGSDDDKGAGDRRGAERAFSLGTARPEQPLDGYLTQPLDLGDQLHGFGQRPVALFLAAYAVLLQAYTDRSSPLIGLAMTTRDHPITEQMVGYFLSVLPVRAPIGGRSFRELAAELERRLATGLARRHVPYSAVLAACREGAEGAGEQAAALSTMFVFDVAHDPRLADLEVRGSIHHNGTSVAAITLFVRELAGGWEASVEFDGHYLSTDDARHLLVRYERFLVALLREPDRPVVEIDLPAPPDDEGAQITTELVPLPDAIIGHGTTQPARPAVRCGEDRLSYQALIDAVEAIADALHAVGVGAGDRVALLVPRSVHTITTILGVLRAGAAYVPIDVDYPEGRRRLILETSQPTAVITTEELRSSVQHSTVLSLRQAIAFVGAKPPRQRPAIQLDMPAYVLYTSGSTGTPRGVEISHRRLASSTFARPDAYGRNPVRYLLVSSSSFDSSVAGLFWTLVAGAELVIPTDVEVHDVDLLGALIESARVTHTLMVPSLYDAVLRRRALDLQSLETVIVAGEACPAALVRRHFEHLPRTELVNEYGPTEATVWSSFHVCRLGDDPVPIGRAVPGTVLRVADPLGRPKPAGVAGELLIGGAGIATGYLNDEVATAQRFVELTDGSRWYRSGDLARRRPDGLLEFLGRLDDQLSLGGTRVEPAEIEKVLVAFAGVDEAVVVAEGGSGGASGRLVAFVVSTTASADELRRHCEQYLPGALVPRRYLIQPELPRTAHGKIDRSALTLASDPTMAGRGSGTRVPTDRLAEVLQIWRAVLADPDLDLDSDFYAAGGDSLAAVELAQRLEQQLGRRVPISSITRARTPREFASQLTAVETEDREERSTLLEVLTVGDHRAPLLVFPGAPGQPVGFAHLAHALDAGQRVVGFRLPGLDDTEPITRTIVGQAERLLPEILGADERPLRLLGLSTGGLLALEVAQRLTACGRPPELVVLADTIYPGRQHLGVESIADHIRRLRVDGSASAVVNGLAKRVRARLRAVILSAMVATYERTGRGLTRAARHKRLEAIAHRAELHYDPKPYAGRVLFFAASTTRRDMTVEPWSEQLTDMRVVEIEGIHHLIVTNVKLVQPLADELQRQLDSTQDGGGTGPVDGWGGS